MSTDGWMDKEDVVLYIYIEEEEDTHTHTHTYLHIYTYGSLCCTPKLTQHCKSTILQ